MSAEEIYKFIYSKEWRVIISFLLKESKAVASEPMYHHALSVFEKEFVNSVSSNENIGPETLSCIEDMYMLHLSSMFAIEKESFEAIVQQLIKCSNSLDVKHQYAISCPDIEISKMIIREYEINNGKKILHSQNQSINVLETQTTENEDCRICLFKSSQEEEFFYALRRIFDTYQIYPNVSMSCLIDYSKIKNKLTQEECDYFFKSVIDFVVFDQAEGFFPKYFFELDSIYHDSEKQKHKDCLKDSIFSKSGIQIYRIRKNNSTISTQEFAKLIREIIK